MSSDSESKSRKLLAEYLVLTFFLSWGLWTPVVMMFADVAQPPLWAVLLVFCGIYGPVLKEVERLALILRWIVALAAARRAPSENEVAIPWVDFEWH